MFWPSGLLALVVVTCSFLVGFWSKISKRTKTSAKIFSRHPRPYRTPGADGVSHIAGPADMSPLGLGDPFFTLLKTLYCPRSANSVFRGSKNAPQFSHELSPAPSRVFGAVLVHILPPTVPFWPKRRLGRAYDYAFFCERRPPSSGLVGGPAGRSLPRFSAPFCRLFDPPRRPDETPTQTLHRLGQKHPQLTTLCRKAPAKEGPEAPYAGLRRGVFGPQRLKEAVWCGLGARRAHFDGETRPTSAV